VIARVSGATSERAGVSFGDGGSLDIARHGTGRTRRVSHELDASSAVPLAPSRVSARFVSATTQSSAIGADTKAGIVGAMSVRSW
jgi:hypothetical protein